MFYLESLAPYLLLSNGHLLPLHHVAALMSLYSIVICMQPVTVISDSPEAAEPKVFCEENKRLPLWESSFAIFNICQSGLDGISP